VECAVAGVTNIKWSSAPFDSLALPIEQKSLLKALAEARIAAGSEYAFDDVVEGKGQGLIALLQCVIEPKLAANQARHSRPLQVDEVFSTIFRRLYSSEAKWMVRMLLEKYSPVLIPEKPTIHRFHFLLPDLLSFQNTFEAAVQLLQAPTIQRMPFHVAKDVGPLLKESAIHSLTPQVGVMVSQPAHEKARSIKHCCQMAHSRRMSVERKYDGEYCQVHSCASWRDLSDSARHEKENNIGRSDWVRALTLKSDIDGTISVNRRTDLGKG
jgi:hypothetical protein